MPPSLSRCLVVVGLLFAAPSVAETDGTVGLQRAVVFSDYSPLLSKDEMATRLLTPLTALRLRQRSVNLTAPRPDQTVDLTQERFALYVPAGAPPAGYALMVFVSSSARTTVPPAWVSALDRHGMILVTAANSGDGTGDFARREPLALLAAVNVMNRYPVDRNRVYIAGFSGGSGVALRLAVGYPDLFRGALLDAGGDVLGENIPPPPAPLFREFQDRGRVIHVADDRDIAAARRSESALRDLCAFDVDTDNIRWSGQGLIDGASLDHGLDRLETHIAPDPGLLGACRTRIDEDIEAVARQVSALIAADKIDAAWAALQRLDTHDGGLATRQILDLAQKLQSRR